MEIGKFERSNCQYHTIYYYLEYVMFTEIGLIYVWCMMPTKYPLDHLDDIKIKKVGQNWINNL